MTFQYELTKPQKLIYDMEQMAGGAISIICGCILREGSSDKSKMQYAANKLLQINDALRTRIIEEHGIAYQTVEVYQEKKIKILNFSNKAELDTYATAFAKVPFDLHGSLSTFLIVELPNRYGLLLKLHHIIGDGWSYSLLAKQFFALLDGEAPPAYSYSDYAASEKAYLKSSRYVTDGDYFMKQFQSCGKVTYLSEKKSNSTVAERKTCLIDKEHTKYIYAYGESHNYSPFMLFIAALSIYMSRVKMNTDKFYLGTPVFNRAGSHEKNTVGMFVNIVPLLIGLNEHQSFLDNLTAVANAAFGILRHQKFNYGDILNTIRKEYGFSDRLYDVHMSYQNAKIIVKGNTESIWYPNGSQIESLQIHIEDRDDEGVFHVHYDYQIEKFAEAEIERIHQQICTLLFDGIAHDYKKLNELDMLS